MQDNKVVPIRPIASRLQRAADRAYKGHSYAVIKNGATGLWEAKLVVPLRPVKFQRDDFRSRIAAEQWIEGIINGFHGEEEDDEPRAS